MDTTTGSTGTAGGAAGEAAVEDQNLDKTFIDPLKHREIGGDAVWSLSTAKPGNGIEQIRDDDLESYWQSDGTQPHLINVQFIKKVTIEQVSLYLDYTSDESYTPKKLSFRVGNTFHDLVEVKVVELHEPVGWKTVALFSQGGTLGPGHRSASPVRAHLLQICVLNMHQNGRDTHVRQVKVFGPRHAGVQDSFSTLEFQQFNTIR